MKRRIAVFSVMPSPYQQDFFAAMNQSNYFDLKVYYQQMSAADSPWLPPTLRNYEECLPGWGFDLGTMRLQCNRRFPSPTLADLWIVNGALTSPSTQWFLRRYLVGRPWIYWAENLRTAKGPKALVQKGLASVLLDASGIAAVGSKAAQNYRQRFPSRRVWNVPYYCKIDPFLREIRKAQSLRPLTFLFCGQMIRRKGIDLLLQAFQRLILGGLEARLVLIGRAANLSIELAKLAPAVRARIDYAGFHQPNALPAYFANSDIFILPSRYDGWGVVLNQALAAGLPIICSDAVGGAYDLVAPEKNGIVVPANDLSALASAMERVAADRSLRQSWGKCSRDLAHNWTPHAGTRQWEAIVKEVLAAP